MRCMSTTIIYSAADAAKRIGCDPSIVRRHCAGKGIGTKLGRDWAITEVDLDALRAVIRPGQAGNPNAVPGNRFFGAASGGRKKRKT